LIKLNAFYVHYKIHHLPRAVVIILQRRKHEGTEEKIPPAM